MATSEGRKDLAELISWIEEQDDPRQSFAALQKHILQYRDAGFEVPQELIEAKRAIETDLILASQGR